MLAAQDFWPVTSPIPTRRSAQMTRPPAKLSVSSTVKGRQPSLNILGITGPGAGRWPSRGRAASAATLLLSPSEHRIEIELGGRRLTDQVRLSVGRLAELRIDVNSRALLLSILRGGGARRLCRAGTGRAATVLLSVEAALLGLRLSPLSRDVVFTVVGEPAPGRVRRAVALCPRASAALRTDYVLMVQVRRELAGPRVVLDLFDAAMAEPAGHGEQSCGDCNLDALLKQVKVTVPSFYKAATARPASADRGPQRAECQ